MQKHSETALDTQKKEDTESSFPMKMHSIVHHQARSSVKFHTFTDELKKLAPNSHSGGANVVQKPKEKSQILENQRFAICKCPEHYLFSNQLLEDSGRIYSLRKCFPTFDD